MQNTIKVYALAYFPSIAWAGLIFALSSLSTLPGFSFSPLEFVFKKAAHMTVYAVLFALLYRARIHTNPQIERRRAWIFPLLICLLYAVSDEIHQSFVPGRYGTLRDVGFDMLGSGLAFLKIYNYI